MFSFSDVSASPLPLAAQPLDGTQDALWRYTSLALRKARGLLAMTRADRTEKAMLHILETARADARIPDAVCLGKLVPWQRKARNHHDGAADRPGKPRKAAAEADAECRMREELRAFRQRLVARIVFRARRASHCDAIIALLALLVDADDTVSRFLERRNDDIPAARPEPGFQNTRSRRARGSIPYFLPACAESLLCSSSFSSLPTVC